MVIDLYSIKNQAISRFTTNSAGLEKRKKFKLVEINKKTKQTLRYIQLANFEMETRKHNHQKRKRQNIKQ